MTNSFFKRKSPALAMRSSCCNRVTSAQKTMLNSPRILNWRTPVMAAFSGSLILSFLAHIGSTLNRDGMLYVKTALAFLDGGLEAATALFNWPFLPILMALTAKATGLNPEITGHLLNALFMAGSCALVVALAQRAHPGSAWWVCLVTLAIPGLNEYRDELLREYGCWFFVMLSFWLAIRWSRNPRWSTAPLAQFSLGAAALFRPEAAALFSALIVWQFIESPREERWRRFLMLGGLPIVVAALLLALYLENHLSIGGRLSGEFGRLNVARFNAKVQGVSLVLSEYAHSNARMILFFGSLALVPIKIINKLGIFIIPLTFMFFAREGRAALSRYRLLSWGIMAHLLVLAVFVTDLQFLAGRYVGLVLLFSAPFIGGGLMLICQRYPRVRIMLIVLSLLIMLNNVISTSPGKMQYVEAGKWLASNATESPKVYIESGRAAYYADWHKIAVARQDRRDESKDAILQAHYELFVLETYHTDAPVDNWLNQLGLRVLKRFDHPNKDAVIIAVPFHDESRQP